MLAVWSGCAGPPPAGFDVTVEVRPGIHDLIARATVAPEDADRLDWTWETDGEQTAFTGDRVPADAVWPGQTWTAIAATRKGSASATVEIPDPPGGNVLLVIIDDVGVEKLAVYGGADAPPTPTIDALADRGVVFRNAYTSPTCTPTRAELLTGRHPARHGAGTIIDMVHSSYELPLAVWSLPELLADAHGPVWDTSAVGKWHLAAYGAPSGELHPTLQGFAWYAGSLGYLVEGWEGSGLDGYFAWPRSHLGETTVSTVYNTTATVDEALDRIEAMPEPFFLWLAFNAPHTPLHVPPSELHTRDVTSASDGAALHGAMLEALDTELGRLFEEMDPGVLANTTVVLLADNGTSELAVAGPIAVGEAKGTLYEGGIHVPLIVAGPHVRTPGFSDALVHAVDVFATIAEIGGVPLGDDPSGRLTVARGGEPRVLDGRSLLPWLADPSAPGPDTVYAEMLYPNGPPPWSGHARMVREAGWKLVRDDSGEHVFALSPDRFDDGPDLVDTLDPEGLLARLRLSAVLDARDRELVYEGF